MRSEEITDAAMTQAHTRDARSDARGDHVSHSDGLPGRITPVLTLRTVLLGGQVPTRNCPITGHMHMHLTLQTHTRQLRAFTNSGVVYFPQQLQCSVAQPSHRFDSKRQMHRLHLSRYGAVPP